MEALQRTAYVAVRTLIPEPQNRTPISWSALPYGVFCWVPYFLIAYLARRPYDTHLIRLLLLPIAIVCMVWPAFHFAWDETLNVYNWGQSTDLRLYRLGAFIATARAIEFSIAPKGMLRCGESCPGQIVTDPPPKSKLSNGHLNHTYANGVLKPRTSILSPPILDTLDLIFSMRGIGWEFGRGVFIPKETKPLARSPFLRATLRSFAFNYILLDFLNFLVKLFPGVGSFSGGSIFYASLPWPQRYAVSTTIHFLTGCSIYTGFAFVYDLLTLFGVYVLHNPPASWPPVFFRPFIADSLHSFWSKRWHQTLRHVFLVYGGYPIRRLFSLLSLPSDLAVVLGVFTVSGLYHECGMYTMGHGLQWRVPVFFALQAPLLVLERLFRRVTGRTVGGRWGVAWVYFCIVVLGQPLTDSWHRRGLGGGMVIPPPISVFNMVLVPLIKQVVRT